MGKRCLLGMMVCLVGFTQAAEAQRATVSSSLTESIPLSEWRVLTLDTVIEDVGGFSSTPETAPTRLTVPAGMGGVYDVDAFVTIAPPPVGVTPPFYMLAIRKNGGSPNPWNGIVREDVRSVQLTGVSSLQATWRGSLAAGDYLELVFWFWSDPITNPGCCPPALVGFPTYAPRSTTLTVQRVDDVADTTIALSGQSNALKLRPYLADALRASGKNLVGWQKGAQQISVWDAGQQGWLGLSQSLGPHVQALVWWQGESDGENGIAAGYQSRLASFIARVRTAVGNPSLPVYLIEVGSHPLFAEIGPQQSAYCASDAHCHFIGSASLPAYVSHMDPAGYATVASLLASVVP